MPKRQARKSRTGISSTASLTTTNVEPQMAVTTSSPISASSRCRRVAAPTTSRLDTGGRYRPGGGQQLSARNLHDAPVSRTPVSRGIRRAFVAGALLVIAACSSSAGPPSPPTPSGSSDTSLSLATPPKETFPKSSSYNLYTHCGVEFLYYEDVYYRTRHPRFGERRGTAPAGWDDPEQRGTLTALSEEHVRFSANGLPTVHFYETSKRPRECT